MRNKSSLNRNVDETVFPKFSERLSLIDTIHCSVLVFGSVPSRPSWSKYRWKKECSYFQHDQLNLILKKRKHLCYRKRIKARVVVCALNLAQATITNYHRDWIKLSQLLKTPSIGITGTLHLNNLDRMLLTLSLVFCRCYSTFPSHFAVMLALLRLQLW